MHVGFIAIRLSCGVLLALFAWTCACPAQAQEQEVTLDQVLSVAVQGNPLIEGSKQEVIASEARVEQAESAYLPQLNAGGGYARNRDWYPGIGLTGAAGGFHETYNSYDTNLSLNQYLYDFGKTDGRVEQSRRNLAATRKLLWKTTADVYLDVKRAYFEVLKQMELVRVQEQSLRTQQQHLEQAQAMYKAGVRPKIDVTKAQVDVSQTKLNLISARYAVQLTLVDLETLLGGPPVEGPYRLAPIRQIQADPITDPDPLFQEALGRRPEIARAQEQIQAAQAQLKTAKGGYLPSLSAGGQFGFQNVDFPLQDAWQVGASLTWELFSGYRTQGEVREAYALISGLRAELKNQELIVARQVSQAVIGVNEDVETIETARVALKEARENLDLAEGRYRSGVGDAIEYSDAQLSYVTARSDLVQSLYQYKQDEANLEYAVGRVVPR
jgi:outer membrane protein